MYIITSKIEETERERDGERERLSEIVHIQLVIKLINLIIIINGLYVISNEINTKKEFHNVVCGYIPLISSFFVCL